MCTAVQTGQTCQVRTAAVQSSTLRHLGLRDGRLALATPAGMHLHRRELHARWPPPAQKFGDIAAGPSRPTSSWFQLVATLIGSDSAPFCLKTVCRPQIQHSRSNAQVACSAHRDCCGAPHSSNSFVKLSGSLYSAGCEQSSRALSCKGPGEARGTRIATAVGPSL